MTRTNFKRKQLSLGQYEELGAKQKEQKLYGTIPKPVLLLLAIPLVILIALLLGYMFYIRKISAQ